MIDYKFKPKYLPQISAPYTVIADLLSKNNVEYSFTHENPHDLEPSQGITISEAVENVDLDDKTKIIWISKDNDILDGHHRVVKAIKYNIPKVFCFKIHDDKLSAARILNKIQDLYEYENIEKEKNPDVFDFGNLSEVDITSENNPIEEIMGYRQEPVIEDSAIGNFFMLIPVEGYKKYLLTFDNVLELKDLDLNLKTGQSIIYQLSKIWFPHYDFSKNQGNENNLRCAAIALMAKKMGYDGIKYSDNLIQAL
ncbi:MAG: hypothetical protein ACOCVF_00360 [bacterium]